MRTVLPFWLILPALVWSTNPVRAFVPSPKPVALCVATADSVVVGKVTAIEDKTGQALWSPCSPIEYEFKIAVINVSETLLGPKGVKSVRLAFPIRALNAPELVAVKPEPNQTPPKDLTYRGGKPPAVGQEGCFFLWKHFQEDFFIHNCSETRLKKSGDDFERVLVEAKRCCKFIADPLPVLKAQGDDAANDRDLAVVMLVTRCGGPGYRGNRSLDSRKVESGYRLETVDAAEGKLVFLALAAAGHAVHEATFPTLQPFLQPHTRDLRAPGATSRWLKELAGTVRIQRVVLESRPKKD